MKRTRTGRVVENGRKLPKELQNEIVLLYLDMDARDFVLHFNQQQVEKNKRRDAVNIVKKITRVCENTDKKYIAKYVNNEEDTKLGRPELETLKSNVALNAYIDVLMYENPFVMLKEIKNKIKDEFNIEISIISKVRTKRLKYKRKRVSQIARKRLEDRVQAMRRLWRETVFHLEYMNFVYIDESHFDFRVLNRIYGAFKKSDKAEFFGYKTLWKKCSIFSLFLANALSNSCSLFDIIACLG